MRYKAGYKQEKRQQLLQSSGQLAKKQGFHITGVDSFMKIAGVTSGAFYSHFSSKNDLFKALIENELQRSVHLWQTNPHQDLEKWIDFELERYLSIAHLEHPEQGCILPTLASEIARAELEIKHTYLKELQCGHDLFTNRLGSAELAWGFLSQMVGAVLMARTMPDVASQHMILNSSKLMIKNALHFEFNKAKSELGSEENEDELRSI